MGAYQAKQMMLLHARTKGTFLRDSSIYDAVMQGV